ncbi:MAG: phage tail length tape measure family protein [Roseococcus sp.]
MSGTMNLAVTVTANAGQLRTELAGARQAAEQLGVSVQNAGGQAGDGFRKMEDGGRRAGAGFREFAAGADAAGRSVAVTSNQMRQLAPQINDVVTQLAMGQSPFMILAAQGGQITQIFGGVTNTLRAVAGAISPLSWAALALGSGLAAIGLQAERQERALIATSQRLRATRDDYLAMGRAVEETANRISRSSSTSTEDARGAGLIIAGQRRFSGDQAELEKLTRLSADLARVMGVDVPAAAERFVARAISDPARAAREATDGGLRGFDEALVRQARLLVASGESGQATALVLGRFGDAARGASGEMTGVQSAWTTLVNSIKGGLSDVGEASASAILRAYRAAYSWADRNALTGPGWQRLQDDRAANAPPAPTTPIPQGPRQALLDHLDPLRRDSAQRYGSVPGRPPIGSTFREPEWARGLAPANGRLWVGPSDGADNTRPEPRAGRTAPEVAGDILRGRGLSNTRSDEQRALEAEIATVQRGLTASIPGSEAATRYAEALEVLRQRLEALKDPIDEANRRQRDQAGLFSIAAGAARELATAELEARENARRAGRDAAGQDAAAGEARSIAQARLNGQLDDAITKMEEERQSILASSTTRNAGTEAVREAQLAQEAHTRAIQFAVQGSPAYEAALARITAQLRANKAAQDEVALGPLLTAQRREGSELERRRGLIGASALERAQSDAESAARERLRASGRPVSGDVADAYVAEERARAENLLGLQRQEAGYQEIGRIGEQAFDRIGSAITQASVNGQSGFKNLRNVGNAVASELQQAFLRLALLNPIKNALGGNSPTLGDAAGGLMKIFGGGGGETFNGLPVVSNITVAHSGAIIGLESPASRSVDPSIFATAPRFHTGGMPGLAADEVPAILQRGEGVFTPEQMRALSPAGGRGDVIFNVAFQGDAGSATDRATLIEGLRGMVRQEIGAAAPGIVNAASGQVAELARRGGSFARDVGRR